jgi:hypothetical protein
MNILAIATPTRVHMGKKYVAELNPNGSVDGKESGCAPGAHMIAKLGFSILVFTAEARIIKLTDQREYLLEFSSVESL